jgi:hypothetical protein
MKPERELNTRALDHNAAILNDASGQGRPLHHRVAASSAAKIPFDQFFDPRCSVRAECGLGGEMTTRRHLLKMAAGAAGVVFCSCAMLDGARAQQPSGQRLPVTVNGKHVKTIDVHAHCLFHEAEKLMGNDNAAFTATVKGAPQAFITLEERLKAMDAMAVDMEVLSVNPFWYRKERDLAAEIVRINNEKLAELCTSKPDRFAGFASVALQFPDLAVEQLETAMKKQGLRGAAIGGSVAGEDFSDPKFHPVWAKAEELGAVLFIHPQAIPELAKRLKGNGWLTNAVGLPTRDIDRAVSPDIRGHARPLPGPQDHLGPWWWVSAVLRRPLGSRLLRQPVGMRSEYHAEKETD